MVGTCAKEDVPALRRHLDVDPVNPSWGPLHNGGVCGLPNWGLERIDVVGNLGERDLTEDDVVDALEEAAMVAPSLNVRVHMGGGYESAKCVSTVFLDDGEALVEPPGIEEIPEITEEQMTGNMLKWMRR